MSKISTFNNTRKYLTGNVVKNSYDPETRELDVIFGSEKPVRLLNPARKEYFLEVLEFTNEAADLSRFLNGAPVLNNHRKTDGVFGQLGVVLNAHIQDRKGHARLKLSDREELAGFRKDVQEGIVNAISFGYDVYQYVRQAQPDINGVSQDPIYRAKSWQGNEISFAPVQADPNARVRSQDNNNEYQTTLIMDENEVPVAEGTREQQQTPAPVNTPLPVAQTRALGTEVNIQEVVGDAVRNERTRSASIEALGSQFGLEQSFVRSLVNEGVDVNEARTRVLAKLAENKPVNGTHEARVSGDEKEKVMHKMAVAQAIRSGEVDVTKFDQALVRESQEFSQMSMLDLARNLMVNEGTITANEALRMSGDSIATRVFENSRMLGHATGDLPALMGNVIHQVLLAPRGILADTWREVADIISVSDFREHAYLRTWGLSNLDDVAENEEFRNKPIADAKSEKISIKTVGNIVGLSRQMIINDQLNVLARLAANLNRAYYRTIESAFYSRLAENTGFGPTMADGLPLFDAAHGNLMTAAAMTGTQLDLMAQQIATQMDEGNVDYLDLRLETLLVRPALRSTAVIYNDAQYDVDVTQKFQVPNKARGLFSKIVDSPRVQSATAYYGFANPNVEPTMAVAFLNGVQTPRVIRQEPFRQEGVEWRIAGDFGVGAIGYKGAVLNKGA